MKRALVVLAALAVLGAMAAPAWAQDAADRGVLRYTGSGTAIALGNPFAGDFSLLANFEGHGPFGRYSSQALLAYQRIDPTVGQLVCGGGQIGIRFESTGDMLLLTLNPGPVGAMWPVSPTAFRSRQSLAGAVVGGTGRFSGATGSFTFSLKGSAAQPGFVHVAQGTLEISLDQK
jgi:hypothetical protein